MRKVFISPSQFAFLYHQCERCFWARHQTVTRVIAGEAVEVKVERPFENLPQIGRIYDGLMKSIFPEGTRLDFLGIAGQVHSLDKKVCSRPIIDGDTEIYVFGYYDMVVALDDETFGIVDFKLTVPREDRTWEYEDQLRSYAYAMENPDRNARVPISKAWLFIVTPTFATLLEDTRTVFTTNPITVMPVDLDRDAYKALLQNVVDIVLSEETPPSDPDCGRCQDYQNMMALAAAQRAKSQALKEKAA